MAANSHGPITSTGSVVSRSTPTLAVTVAAGLSVSSTRSVPVALTATIRATMASSMVSTRPTRWRSMARSISRRWRRLSWTAWTSPRRLTSTSLSCRAAARLMSLSIMARRWPYSPSFLPILSRLSSSLPAWSSSLSTRRSMLRAYFSALWLICPSPPFSCGWATRSRRTGSQTGGGHTPHR